LGGILYNKNKERMTRLKIFLLALLGWLNVSSSFSQNTMPKLVIGIVIDDLRADCLEAFREHFSGNGLRRIFDGGASTLHLPIPYYSVDAAPDYVSAFSGASPSVHGIVANRWFNRNLNRMTEFNPGRISLSTLADELKQRNSRSKVIVIAHNSLQTIAMAGKKPDAAIWLDDASTHWKTSDVYGTMPDWALAANRKRPLGKPEVPLWKPLSGNAFSHSMRSYQNASSYFKILKTTPWANDEVSAMAQKILIEKRLGRGGQTDMLLVGFSAKDFSENRQQGISPELKDIYLRLDRQIADLLLTTESFVKQQEILVFVLANQSNYLQQNTPSETISAQKISSLLNLFLSAKYGQTKWIQHFADNQVYLDHKAINTKGYRVEVIAGEVADFLSGMSGVQAAYTAQQLQNSCGDALFGQMQQAYNKTSSGDVMFAFTPGKLRTDERDNPLSSTRNLYADIPFALFGNNIKTQTISADFSILDIAVTISHRLGISKPNGSLGREMTIIQTP
jgi:hypothetical protein